MSKCAVTATMSFFSAKWKPCILSQLMYKERRYSELMRLMPNVSKKMLTEHLKELENDGLVQREVFPSVPPQVTYSITQKGKSLEGIFRQMSDWGMDHLDNVRAMEDMVIKISA